VQGIFSLLEFCASLQLAVVLIGLSAVTLGWATFVESYYGHPCKAVNYGIYGTWWFTAMNGLLGLNVLCAALVRFPWKKYQTGFVVTHAGILLLLAGSWLSRSGGVDASLPVFEGKAEWRAFEDSQHFQLTVTRDAADGNPAHPPAPEVIDVPFVTGPFNWDDYGKMFWFPWALARRDRGVIYDRDGIKLEALDYYADSVQLPIPRLVLRTDAGVPIELAAKDASGALAQMRPYGAGDHRTLPGGQEVLFWMTGDDGETAAFRDGQPEGDVGPQGQVVLNSAGKKYAFPVDQLGKKKRQPLGSSGFEVELIQFLPDQLAVKLLIYHGTDKPQPMALLAGAPDLNHHDYHDRIYGCFWYPPAGENNVVGEKKGAEMPAEAVGPRIDFLQGADRRLYCRGWRGGKLQPAGVVPVGAAADAARVAFFAGSSDRVGLRVEQFLPSDTPGSRVLSLPHVRDKEPVTKSRQARVRLTVDDRTEEFWLPGIFSDAEDSPLPPGQRHAVRGRGRSVSLILPWDQIDIGFQVFLHKFERKLDPGTSAASYYASLVDFRDRWQQSKPLQQNVLVTLNEPLNFTDPYSHRSFRIYQASFATYKPGDEIFEQIVGGADMRDHLFESVLTVNYDPGRGLKYAGCLGIVAGIVILFYMKAYFFRSARTGPHAVLHP
jgi:hypothetical protein